MSDFKKLDLAFCSRFFVYLFFICFPFSIDFLFYTPEPYTSGFFNEYLSFFIHLADIFLMISVSLFLFHCLKNNIKIKIGDRTFLVFLILLLIVVFFSVFYSGLKLVSFLYFLRILEFFVLYLLIINLFSSFNKLIWILIILAVFQSFLGIIQFILQESAGFYFLGEPLLSTSSNLSSTFVFNGHKLLRAYGTFKHPNILGGFLGISIILSLYFLGMIRTKFARRWLIIALLFMILAMILSFSRAAFIGVVLVAFFTLFFGKNPKKHIYLILISVSVLLIFYFFEPLAARFSFTDFLNLKERVLFLKISSSIFSSNPFGIGISTFTNEMQNFSEIKLYPWMLQPVHNIYLLFLNETGIQGGLVFVFVFVYLVIKPLLLYIRSRQGQFAMLFLLMLFVSIIGFFDHYLLTVYQGQVILWSVFSIWGFFVRNHS